MTARVYEFPSGRRIDHLHPVEPDQPSHDEMSPTLRDTIWRDIERHERIAEGLRRRLGVLMPELGVPPLTAPGRGQLSIADLKGDKE